MEASSVTEKIVNLPIMRGKIRAPNFMVRIGWLLTVLVALSMAAWAQANAKSVKLGWVELPDAVVNRLPPDWRQIVRKYVTIPKGSESTFSTMKDDELRGAVLG